MPSLRPRTGNWSRVPTPRIADAITAYRRDREPAVVSRRVGLAVTATVALFAAGFILRRIGRRIRVRLEKRFRSRTREVAIQTFRVVTTEQMWAILLWLLRVAGGIAFLATLDFYLRYTLALFPWDVRTFAPALRDRGDRPAAEHGARPHHDVPESRVPGGAVPDHPRGQPVMLAVLRDVADGRVSLGSSSPNGRNRPTSWCGWWSSCSRWSWPTRTSPVRTPTPSRASRSSSASCFSLGSSSVIANVIAGYMMTYRRAFKVGDRVKIGDLIGDVARVRLQVTHLRTVKNEEVIVPNSTILNSEVVNYSALRANAASSCTRPWASATRRRGGRSRRCCSRPRSARRGCWPDPPPFVRQQALGDFASPTSSTSIATRREAMRLLYAELHRNILDVFNEYGVQIMTPAYEGDPGAAEGRAQGAVVHLAGQTPDRRGRRHLRLARFHSRTRRRAFVEDPFVVASADLQARVGRQLLPHRFPHVEHREVTAPGRLAPPCRSRRGTDRGTS